MIVFGRMGSGSTEKADLHRSSSSISHQYRERALHTAAVNNHTEVTRMLIEANAVVDPRDFVNPPSPPLPWVGGV